MNRFQVLNTAKGLLQYDFVYDFIPICETKGKLFELPSFIPDLPSLFCCFACLFDPVTPPPSPFHPRLQQTSPPLAHSFSAAGRKVKTEMKNDRCGSAEAGTTPDERANQIKLYLVSNVETRSEEL
jgi:hypothetical protein